MFDFAVFHLIGLGILILYFTVFHAKVINICNIYKCRWSGDVSLSYYDFLTNSIHYTIFQSEIVPVSEEKLAPILKILRPSKIYSRA